MIQIDRTDIMIGNLVVDPDYYRNEKQPARYFLVKDMPIWFVNLSDGRISTQYRTENVFCVPISQNIFDALNIIDQFKAAHPRYELLIIGKNKCHIIHDKNFVGCVNYIHELQNWIYWHCNKFTFDFSSIYEKLNARNGTI